MQEQIARTEKRLNELADEVLSREYGLSQSVQEWCGADVVITSPPLRTRGECYFPEPRYIVSPNAKQLSRLFYDISEAFAELLDCSSKMQFYRRLAMAALDYQEDLGGITEDRIELLSAVILEAEAMLAEMKQRSFPGWQWRRYGT
jgi:hypothetical protein